MERKRPHHAYGLSLKRGSGGGIRVKTFPQTVKDIMG